MDDGISFNGGRCGWKRQKDRHGRPRWRHAWWVFLRGRRWSMVRRGNTVNSFIRSICGGSPFEDRTPPSTKINPPRTPPTRPSVTVFLFLPSTAITIEGKPIVHEDKPPANTSSEIVRRGLLRTRTAAYNEAKPTTNASTEAVCGGPTILAPSTTTSEPKPTTNTSNEAVRGGPTSRHLPTRSNPPQICGGFTTDLPSPPSTNESPPRQPLSW